MKTINQAPPRPVRAPAERSRLFSAYGLSISSEIPLSAPSFHAETPSDITILKRDRFYFQDLKKNIALRQGEPGAVYFTLNDRSIYSRFFDLYHFHISSDGCTIRTLNEGQNESFRSYLETNAISFALLQKKIDSIHATVIEAGNGAVAFTGESGAGKSTLAAYFLLQGHRLLTDDLLVTKAENSRIAALPGIPRVKLLPESAGEIPMLNIASGKMNPLTSKLIFGIPEKLSVLKPLRLKHIYVLGGDSKRVKTERLSGQETIVELLKASYNLVVQNRDRLAAQFLYASEMARAVPVSRLAYPRRFSSLHDVREAVLSDLR